MTNSYDVIEKAVKDYWEENYPQDVVVFFQQKYSWDDKWERCEELVECHGSIDYENMTFLSDFCEGQTEVKDVVIVPLREVTSFYYERKIEKHESKSIEPCPFCGGSDIDIRTDDCGLSWYSFCNDCGVMCGYSMTKDDVMNAWNRRAERVDSDDFRKRGERLGALKK